MLEKQRKNHEKLNFIKGQQEILKLARLFLIKLMKKPDFFII